jgi:hypothetical protein
MTLSREVWEAVAAVLRLKRVDQRRFLDHFGVSRPREIPAARLIEVLRLAMEPTPEMRGQQ